MYREIIISVQDNERRIALLEDGQMVEFFIEIPSHKSLVGNIYKGRVEKIVPGIGAAFIDIGLRNKNGFIYLRELNNVVFPSGKYGDVKLHSPHIEDLLKVGEEIIVQVERDSFGDKGPKLKSNITLAGHKVILLPWEEKFVISNKIQDEEERTRLQEIINELDIPKGKGLIIRTSACGCEKDIIKEEFDKLLEIWEMIIAKAEKRKAPCLLYEEPSLLLQYIRDRLNNEIKRLLVDDEELYSEIMGFVAQWLAENSNKIFLEEGNLFLKRNLHSEIEKVYSRIVELKCGGYLTIDETEAMVVIDVNTGSFTGFKRDKLDLEHTAYVVNMEAAKEIARQIRLRNLSGIIIIDFIDLHNPFHREELEKTFRNEMEKDRLAVKIFPLSELCTLQLTREKIRDYGMSYAFQVCPHCHGRGIVKSC